MWLETGSIKLRQQGDDEKAFRIPEHSSNDPFESITMPKAKVDTDSSGVVSQAHTSPKSQYDDELDNEIPKPSTPTPPSSAQLRERMKRKWLSTLLETDTSSDRLSDKYRKLEEARTRQAREAADASARELLVRYQSLPITPLAALTEPNKLPTGTRCDVLALIISVKPGLTRHKSMAYSRDLLIMDASTPEKIELSVFADPKIFCPQQGTVAMIKHLRIYDSQPRSLRACVEDCDGKEWFIPDPSDFEQGEVAQLKDCWARIQFSEQSAHAWSDTQREYVSALRDLERPDTRSQHDEGFALPAEVDVADQKSRDTCKKHLTCMFGGGNGRCKFKDEKPAYDYSDFDNSTIPGSNINEATGEGSAPFGLPSSRGLTCFFWANGRRCFRSDEECSYAHYETGTVARAPPGVAIMDTQEESKATKAKTLTCYFWDKNGKCSRSDEACPYAHFHTGTVAYPPTVASSQPSTADRTAPASSISKPSQAASTSERNPLTCFFWATYGRCTRSDTGCTYAHYNTGTIAHNPNPSAFPVPKLPTSQQQLSTGLTALSPAAPLATSATERLLSASAPAPTPTPTPFASSVSSAGSPSTNATPAATTSSPFPPAAHLTCYFWANFGRCKRSDEECSYAHFHTGKMAANPLELRKKKG